jgi:hypothetical protein
MIIGTLSLRHLERIYRDARINEPFVFAYSEPGNHEVSGLITGYFDYYASFGRVCVFQNVIVTKDAVDRMAVKRDLPIYAMRAAFAAPVDVILTSVEHKHPLREVLAKWTTETLGGTYYAHDGDSQWFYITKETFNG